MNLTKGSLIVVLLVTVLIISAVTDEYAADPSAKNSTFITKKMVKSCHRATGVIGDEKMYRDSLAGKTGKEIPDKQLTAVIDEITQGYDQDNAEDFWNCIVNGNR